MITKKEREKLVKFIYSREQPEGGFSFTPSTPPTLEDTFFAFRLLEELDGCFVSKQTISYINKLQLNEFHNPKHLYQLANLYRISNLVDSKNLLREKINSDDKFFVSTIADLYYMVMAKLMLKISVNTLTENEQKILSTAQTKTVKPTQELKHLIILMKKLHIPFQSKEYILMIRNSQNHDGGFGITPHSTSYIEPTYHALRGLEELNALPDNIDRCELFVKSCISNIGGFGRQITTVPSIEYSYYAVSSLKIIDVMKK